MRAGDLSSTVLLLYLLTTVVSARPSIDNYDQSEDSRSIGDPPIKERRHKSVSAALHHRIGGASMPKDELAKLSKQALDSLRSTSDDENKRMKHERRQRLREQRKGRGRRKDLTKYPLVTLPPVETVDEKGREIAEGWKEALGRTYADWKGGGGEHCQAHPFKQSIKHEGCLTKIVVNRFCVGVCTSIYIPRMRAKKLKAQFESQSKCAPSEVDTMRIALECPGQTPDTQEKVITIVKECKCQAVNVGSFF
ncbi:hypothetical protein PFISCL1PPCAC_321 [Pristionchus fissidentatus]|uniref:CTCK domain-containing protein n=1 Tax=Pristionchus fissidentatus TaxID=1538716 RepID=A0AAV5UTB0_9BILA|nr:hypothetical protein PFISCL1PPCAC_321 [Pristionchus fissidentatus]